VHPSNQFTDSSPHRASPSGESPRLSRKSTARVSSILLPNMRGSRRLATQNEKGMDEPTVGHQRKYQKGGETGQRSPATKNSLTVAPSHWRIVERRSGRGSRGGRHKHSRAARLKKRISTITHVKCHNSPGFKKRRAGLETSSYPG